jgi:hypothetical protein
VNLITPRVSARRLAQPDTTARRSR